MRRHFWRSTSIRGLSFCLFLASDTTLSFSLVFLVSWSPKRCTVVLGDHKKYIELSVWICSCALLSNLCDRSFIIVSSFKVQRALPLQELHKRRFTCCTGSGKRKQPIFDSMTLPSRELCGGESDLAERIDLSGGGWQRWFVVAPSCAGSEPT